MKTKPTKFNRIAKRVAAGIFAALLALSTAAYVPTESSIAYAATKVNKISFSSNNISGRVRQTIELKLRSALIKQQT